MTKKHFDFHSITEMEQRYRTAFINSLGGFKSVALIGTQNKAQQTNLAIFNSFVHIGANPPIIGCIIRPDSVERHTLSNIVETGFYTINHILPEFIQQAHQTSARYPNEISEFDAVGLTPEVKANFFAPFVKESTIQIGVKMKEKVNIECNGTILLIGEIVDVYLPDEVILQDGFIDLEKARTITNSGLDSYHEVSKGKRFPYAKP